MNVNFGYNTHSKHSNLRLLMLQSAQNLPLNNKNAPAVGASPQVPLSPPDPLILAPFTKSWTRHWGFPHIHVM